MYQPGGVLSLGQILSDPCNPASALHPEGPPDLPEKLKLDITTQKNVDVFEGSLGTLLPKFSAMAIAVAGASADASVGTTRSQTGYADAVTTTMVTPSNSFVDDCLRHGDVPGKLKSLTRTRLFMVTGIKVFKGARMELSDERSKAAGAKVEADGTSLGVLGRLGGSISGVRKSKQSTSFGGATDYIFAYTVQEIIWNPIFGTVAITTITTRVAFPMMWSSVETALNSPAGGKGRATITWTCPT